MNVISFSLSLCVALIKSGEREREKSAFLSFARGSAQRREATRRNYDLKTIERKKKGL